MARDRLVRDLQMFEVLKEMVFVLCWAINGFKEGNVKKKNENHDKRKERTTHIKENKTRCHN